MKLIVGLGNPGEKYQETRHNLGFMVLEKLASSVERLGSSWEYEGKFKSEILKRDDLILAKPRTYMNNSGMAVGLLINFFKIKLDDVWVIHDDIDLPLGLIRIRFGGSSGGHKGIESIIEKLKTEKFWRFRLGIWGKKEIERQTEKHKKIKLRHVEDFVLSQFEKDEAAKARDLVRRGAKAIELALEEGLEKAMNKYNANIS